MKKIWCGLLSVQFALCLCADGMSRDTEVEDRTLLLEGAYKKVQTMVFDDKGATTIRTEYPFLDTLSDVLQVAVQGSSIDCVIAPLRIVKSAWYFASHGDETAQLFLGKVFLYQSGHPCMYGSYENQIERVQFAAQMIRNRDIKAQNEVRRVLSTKSLQELEAENPLVYGIMVTQRKRAE